MATYHGEPWPGFFARPTKASTRLQQFDSPFDDQDTAESDIVVGATCWPDHYNTTISESDMAMSAMSDVYISNTAAFEVKRDITLDPNDSITIGEHNLTAQDLVDLLKFKDNMLKRVNALEQALEQQIAQATAVPQDMLTENDMPRHRHDYKTGYTANPTQHHSWTVKSNSNTTDSVSVQSTIIVDEIADAAATELEEQCRTEYVDDPFEG